MTSRMHQYVRRQVGTSSLVAISLRTSICLSTPAISGEHAEYVTRLWNDLGMIASYREFIAEHGAEHLHPFNRWCAAVGNPLSVVGPVLMLLGRRKSGAALAALGLAVVISGHVAEGNLPRNIRVFFRHPIWSLRADFAVARETIRGNPSIRGQTHQTLSTAGKG